MTEFLLNFKWCYNLTQANKIATMFPLHVVNLISTIYMKLAFAMALW